MRIPTTIQQDFRQRHNDKDPVAAVRAMCAIDQSLGESIILASDRELVIYSKRIGTAYTDYSFALDEIGFLAVELDRPFAYFVAHAAARKLRLKCAANDCDELQRLQAIWQAVHSGTQQPAASPADAVAASDPDAPKLTAFLGFGALLVAMMEADSEADVVERANIIRILGDNDTFRICREWHSRLGTEALLRELSSLLSAAQKLCLIANVLEVSMTDGSLRGSEQVLLQQARDALDIDADAFTTIYDAMVIKNNLSVFNN